MHQTFERFPMKPLALVAATLLAGWSAQALAQEASLNTVVVTASGFEQQIKEAPASITVITREELEKKAFRDLTDALSSVEGVAVTGVNNEKDIYIRGLPGSYTLILVDGRRQSTREARTNGNSGFEQSFVPPVEAIERIEIVRGPMSSLYGSDAMGGVINIITRKVPKQWGGSVGVDYTVQDSDYGDSHQEQFFIGGPIKSDVLGLQVWGRSYHRSEDKLLSGTSDAGDRNLTARLAITPNANHEFLVQAGTERVERRAAPGKTISAAPGRGGAPASPTYNQNDRDHFSLSHNGRWGWANTELSLSHEAAQRNNHTYSHTLGAFTPNVRSPEIKNTVLDGKIVAPLGNNLLTLGAQVVHAKLEDTNPGLRDTVVRSFSSTQKALFAENEWSITERLKLTTGLRLDDSAYGLNLSPRVYTVWSATDALTLKGGVSRGYKTPDLRQSTPGYAYTTGGGSCVYGGTAPTCGVALGNPDLKPETSTSYELGGSWNANEKLSLGAVYFYTDFKNKLINDKMYDASGSTIPWSEDAGYILFEHKNVERAKLQGLELTANWQVATGVKLKGSYTYTQSKQKGGDYDGRPLARTPKHQASLRADWDATSQLNLWTGYSFHGKEVNSGLRIGTAGTDIGGAREYASYQYVDLGASYKVGKQTTLNAAIYNLNDKRVETATHNAVGEGRRLWLGMNVKF